MPQDLAAAVAAFAPRWPLAVALSGGADSTALLAACAARWPGRLQAIHVHHGLQAAADEFAAACAALCERLGVTLHVVRVNARHVPGESPEDAARNARYVALAASAREHGIAGIALAQHADDQVESVLLALSRGAGLPGLAGMRTEWERDGVHFHRPLIEVRGDALRAWLREQGIAWVEDPTNGDERFTRNRIRARLAPAWGEAFPAYREMIARSARHAAQAQRLVDQVAAEDLVAVGDPPRIDALRALSREREANVIRHWLRVAHGAQASAAQLEELLAQLQACITRGHRIDIKVGEGFVRRDGPLLHYVGHVAR